MKKDRKEVVKRRSGKPGKSQRSEKTDAKQKQKPSAVGTKRVSRRISSAGKDNAKYGQAEKPLGESQTRIQLIIDNIDEVVYSTQQVSPNSLIGIPNFVSDRSAKILGFHPREFMDDPELWFRLIHPEDKQALQDQTSAIFESRQPGLRLYRLRQKQTGHYRWFEDHVVPQLDEMGNVIGTFGVARDITGRKEAEQRTQTLLEASPDGIMVVKADGKISLANRQCEALFGYTMDELIGEPVEMLVPERFRQRHLRYRDNYVQAAYPREMGAKKELIALRKDGAEFPVTISLSPMMTEEGLITTIVIRDIAERKRAEQFLRESEERFRSLFENSPLAIWEEDFSQVKAALDELMQKGGTDLNDLLEAHPEIVSECLRQVRVLDVNHAALKLYEAETKSDLLGFLDKTFPEEVIKRFKNELLLIARGGREYRSESLVNTLQGARRDVLVHWAVAPGSEQDYSRVLVSLTDVTEQKQAEEKLRESEKRFRALIENSSEEVSLLAADGSLLYESPSANPTLGYAPGEFLGHSLFQLVHLEDLERVQVRFTDLVQSPGSSVRDQFRLRHKSGEWRWVEALGTNLLDEPAVQAVVVNYHDITERRQAEESLRDREQRLDAIIQNEPECIKLLNADGALLQMNPAGLAMIEADSLQSVLEKPLYSIVSPEYREAFRELNNRVFRGESGKLEFEIVGLKGTRRWVDTHAVPMRNDQGEVIALLGITRDITERKLAEQALEAAEKKYRNLVERLPVVVYTSELGVEGRWIYVSPHIEELLGFTAEEWLEDSTLWYRHIHPEDRERQSALEEQAWSRGEPFDSEYRMFTREGREVWIRDIGHILPPQNGGLPVVQGTLMDVSARKLAEAELRRNEERLQLFFSQSLDGFFFSMLEEPVEWNEAVDKEKTIEYVLTHQHVTEANDAMLKQYGVERADLIGRTPAEFFAHDLDQARRFRRALFDAGHLHLETEERTEDGKPLWVEGDYVCMRDDQNRITGMFGIQRDITERKRAERELQASEERFRLLAGNIREVFWITDPVAKKDVYLSPAYEEVWGRRLEEQLRDRNVFIESVLPEDRRMVQETIEKQVQGRKTEMEYRIRRPDGSIRWIWDRAFPIFDESQTVKLITGIAADITERKQAEAETLRHLDELQALYENGLAVGRLLSPREIGERVIQTFTEYLSWHHVTIRLRKGESDDLELVAFSIPHLKEEDKAIVEGNFNARINKVGQGMSGWVVQTGTAIRTGNVHDYPQYVDTYEEIKSGMYMPLKVGDQIIGSISVESEVADAFTQQDERLLATLATQAAVAFENARLYQAVQQELGERRHAEDMLAQERNSLANRVEERTSELISANANLARALRVKDEFLANMSHELRTPLNAILGLSESLSEQVAGPLNDKQKKYLQTITESGHHLLSLINDILDLAKIEAGQVTLDISKVDVYTLCQSSLRMVKQIAQKKNQEVSLEIDKNFGLIWADERRLKQMIVNLLSNAVKFTPEGGKLGLEVHGDKNENRVLITVWDSGIGIAESDIAKLFQPFVQLSTGLARESTGTGLGLALVAQMARLHGGGVSVSSKPGEGSRFTLVLPWEPALAPDTMERMKTTGKFRAVKLTGNQPRRSILLIEDTADVGMMVSDYLEAAGYKVIIAKDGAEGLSEAKRIHPDLILMDLQMPRMDGFEATRELRNDPAFKNTPIIALTALAMQGDRERCLAAGMDEYITKPVNLKALVKIIDRCFQPAA